MSWRTRAACRGYPSRLWFSYDPDEQARAAAVCDRCPVRGPCLDEAMERGEIHGIWGGLTVKERRRAGMVPHGTVYGYTRFWCRCADCREAMRVNAADNRRPLAGVAS